MKIAHVIDYFQPRLGYQETYLAKEQIRQGHDVCAFTSDRYRPALYRGEAAVGVLGNRIRPLGSHREMGIPVRRLPTILEFKDRTWLLGLQAALMAFDPDVIHMHGLTSLSTFQVLVASLSGDHFSTRVLLIDDHMNPRASRGWPSVSYYPLKRLLIPMARKTVDHFIAVSDTTKSYMIEYYGFRDRDIGIIPLGVDTEMFRRNDSVRTSMRRYLKYDEEDVVCIYTGKMLPRKRVEMIIEALCHLPSGFWNVHLLLVGYADEGYERKLRIKIKRMAMGDRVRWLPAVSQAELSKLFAVADIAIWPAEHSISLLEAMACGLPIIVSDEPRSREDVSHGNGFAFPEGNVRALAECVLRLVSNPDLRQAMGARGRRIVEQEHSWKAVNQSFIRCYTEKRMRRRTQ